MFLEKESKSCIHSVITVNICILNKALITVKCPYLIQRSHHQLTLFLMVCHSENLKTYEIWLLYSEAMQQVLWAGMDSFPIHDLLNLNILRQFWVQHTISPTSS